MGMQGKEINLTEEQRRKHRIPPDARVVAADAESTDPENRLEEWLVHLPQSTEN